MTVNPIGGRTTTRMSAAGKIPLGEWTHVAGVSCGGHLSVGRDTLYVNGVEVLNESASDALGLTADRTATPIYVGGAPQCDGFAGMIDQVRVHGLVAKFWPQEPMPWIDRIAAEGVPPLDSVPARDRQPVLSFTLDGDIRPVASAERMMSDPAIVERYTTLFEGEYIPGVRGKAVRGKLDVHGFRMADWREGSLDAWVRPHRVNNVSDRNITLIATSGFHAYFKNTVEPAKRLSLFYLDVENNLRMFGDSLGTEFHPGRWYHVAFTWDASAISMYVDGKLAAAGENDIGGRRGQGELESVRFNDSGPVFDVDELEVYDVRLSAAEVANRYWSYVDPRRMTGAAPPAPMSLEAWRMPSANAIYYRLKRHHGVEASSV
jgi:hypothetical protein